MKLKPHRFIDSLRIFIPLIMGPYILLGCASKFASPNGSLLRSLEDGKYDYNNFLLIPETASVERVAASLLFLRTHIELKGKTDEKVVQLDLNGIGIVLYDRYILTLSHVVSQDKIVTQTPFGPFIEPAEILREETYLIHEGEEKELKRILNNPEEDIAIFELPRGLKLNSFPYSIGNSDELRVGNFVYVIGNPANAGINVREGIISSLNYNGKIPSLINFGNSFMVSNGVNPGDSGIPVVALRDGRFELVGLAQGTMLQTQKLGWAVRINRALKLISEIIEVKPK